MTDYLDSATATLALTPSSTQVFGGVDAATIRLSLTGSALEGKEYADAGTGSLRFTVTGIEVQLRVAPSFQVNMMPRWFLTNHGTNRYVATEVNKKYLISYFGKAPNVPDS